MSITSRRHGWQRPLHPLQIVGMVVFCVLASTFYCFLGLFLGNPVAEITVITIFSFSAIASALLFVRCAATDPSDKTRFRFRNKKKSRNPNSLNLAYIFGVIIMRLFKRIERKILKTCIRRKYNMDPIKNSSIQIEPLIPFPLVHHDDDSISPSPKDDAHNLSFCALCDFEVKKHSKHCRACDRCVEGFDHHCRWLNNCVGKKNYTTFILLLIFVLLMLAIEGGTAIAIFVRCFLDKKGIEHELKSRHYGNFPRGLLAGISVVLFLLTAYSTAALGQLFFFHVLLIRKGISTYDYILAMKEENERSMMEPDSLEEDSSDFSSDDDDIIDLDSSPEKPRFISLFICNQERSHEKLSIKIDKEPKSPVLNKKQGFRASINPWKLINLSTDKARLAAEKAKQRLVKTDPMKQLPLETRSGPLMKPENYINATGLNLTPLISKGMFLNSPSHYTSPSRRLSCSSTVQSLSVPSPKQRYRGDFDLKLIQVSRELETYISRQVLCSVLKDKNEDSPR